MNNLKNAKPGLAASLDTGHWRPVSRGVRTFVKMTIVQTKKNCPEIVQCPV